tara:strand:- start:890 stop:1147 length:258 start_codon:yes stop_codon:yes gene_type:complete
MLAYRKAKKLFVEWENNEWSTRGQMHVTLKILMDDMNRCCNDYNKVKSKTNLSRLVTKYKKAKEYYDNYKYNSMLLGMSNGPTVK